MKIRSRQPNVKRLRRYTASIAGNAMTASKMMKWTVATLGALLLAGPPTVTAVGIPPAPPAERPATFTKDIAPILYKQCAPCHQPDGPAPFSLITYDEVRRHAA